jgi:hypothetical protein
MNKYIKYSFVAVVILVVDLGSTMVWIIIIRNLL